MTIFVLVHSPLVGPATWAGVADALRGRGLGVVVPELRDREGMGTFWRQHALSVAGMLRALPAGRQVVLAGHSGAGSLLPAIREQAERDISAYLFVDAGIPEDGRSRLDLLSAELPEVAAALRPHLEAGGAFPTWTDADLAEAIPDAGQRGRVLAELQPRALSFWKEPLPVFHGWPDAACAYLRLGEGYAVPLARALRDGWAVAELERGHFGQVVDPDGVTEAMLDLTRACGIPIAAGVRR